MTMLQALSRLGERMEADGHLPPLGYSPEKISYVISLHDDGTPAGVHDIRDVTGKKPVPRTVAVPQAIKRTSGVAPNFLWDKTAYVLGVTAGEGKRLAEEHAAFVERHLTELKDADDAGLVALHLFLERWTPADFVALDWPEAMKDQNVVFALESERRSRYLHDRPAAKALWARMNAAADATLGICLVSGETAPIAVLHPSIKGVWGAQSSGASLVSFNQPSFESYGHEQGLNAPMSVAAAARYGGALNDLLRRDSGHSVQIGDASTVFWAEAVDPDVSADDMAIVDAVSQEWFADIPEVDLTKQSAEVGAALSRLRSGEPIALVRPQLAKGVRFYVLGLSPNAARLSVRFYLEDDFGAVAETHNRFVQDMRFEPRSKDRPISIRHLVLRTATARRDDTGKVKYDAKSISPLLSGELFRSVLTGNRFPAGLLSLLLLRIRSDHVLDALRVSMIKAIIVRNMRHEGRLPLSASGSPMEEYLMRSDPDDQNAARRLGKLFALIERAQLAALGDEINSTVKDKYFGSCAATPAQTFPKLLVYANQHHLKRLRNGHSDAKWIKDASHARRVGAAIDRDMGRLAGTFEDGFPALHSDEEQGLFVIGYYQERYGKTQGASDGDDLIEDDVNDANEPEGQE
ncbi:type I-C CRISPR-associated protein Cas8c/Csd1 [Pannonibacter phragmitetus]|uniref:type I-C CRISPR-associated protein Cas8c/Csd1 n=1 Tax=Pannonibacter phragmitetus TaxID=121719 RepID=UPI0009E91D3E|nr:type I-C CRISPR-associated protein Cas8c/Csd1 [Pannonibacter phragmitetus]